MKYLSFWISLLLFISARAFEIEKYYILNYNYCIGYINNEEEIINQLPNAIYSKTTYLKKLQKLARDETYTKNAMEIIFGESIDLTGYWESNDPFDLLKNTKSINRKTLCNFSILFGNGIIKRKINSKYSHTFFNINPTEQDKKAIEMYQKILTNDVDKTLKFDDELLKNEMQKINGISSNFLYAIHHIHYYDLVDMIYTKKANPIVAEMFNSYGGPILNEYFINVVISKLISKNNKIGYILDTNKKWNDFMKVIEHILTNYQYPMKFNMILSENSELYNQFDNDINKELYELYSNFISISHKHSNSMLANIINELSIINLNSVGIFDDVNITKDMFFEAVTNLKNIFSSENEIFEKTQIHKDFSTELIIEQVVYMCEYSRISTQFEIEFDETLLDTVILNLDIVLKYGKSIENTQLYNKLVDCINYYIDSKIYLNDQYTINNLLLENNTYSYINVRDVRPYKYKEKTDDDLLINVLAGVDLIKTDLNSIFQEGDVLINGFERDVCLMIQKSDYSEPFITNQLNKDCIFKGAKAANEAIYKLVKYYYNLFIKNCINDLNVDGKKLTSNEILNNYIHIYYLNESIVQYFELPTIKIIKDMNFVDIFYYFNLNKGNYKDKYLEEAYKLIYNMGLYMIDASLLYENLNVLEDVKYEYNDLFLPKYKEYNIQELENSNISFNSNLINIDYNGYFNYQYKTLMYYIDDNKEDLIYDNHFAEIAFDIKNQAGELIYFNWDHDYDYFGNTIILSEIIDNYEKMISIPAKYVYETEMSESYYKDYLPDDHYLDMYYKHYSDFDEYYSFMENNIVNSTSIDFGFSSITTIINDINKDMIDYSETALNYISNSTSIDGDMDLKEKQNIFFIYSSLKSNEVSTSSKTIKDVACNFYKSSLSKKYTNQTMIDEKMEKFTKKVDKVVNGVNIIFSTMSSMENYGMNPYKLLTLIKERNENGKKIEEANGSDETEQPYSDSAYQNDIIGEYLYDSIKNGIKKIFKKKNNIYGNESTTSNTGESMNQPENNESETMTTASKTESSLPTDSDNSGTSNEPNETNEKLETDQFDKYVSNIEVCFSEISDIMISSLYSGVSDEESINTIKTNLNRIDSIMEKINGLDIESDSEKTEKVLKLQNKQNRNWKSAEEYISNYENGNNNSNYNTKVKKYKSKSLGLLKSSNKNRKTLQTLNIKK